MVHGNSTLNFLRIRKSPWSVLVSAYPLRSLGVDPIPRPGPPGCRVQLSLPRTHSSPHPTDPLGSTSPLGSRGSDAQGTSLPPDFIGCTSVYPSVLVSLLFGLASLAESSLGTAGKAVCRRESHTGPRLPVESAQSCGRDPQVSRSPGVPEEQGIPATHSGAGDPTLGLAHLFSPQRRISRVPGCVFPVGLLPGPPGARPRPCLRAAGSGGAACHPGSPRQLSEEGRKGDRRPELRWASTVGRPVGVHQVGVKTDIVQTWPLTQTVTVNSRTQAATWIMFLEKRIQTNTDRVPACPGLLLSTGPCIMGAPGLGLLHPPAFPGGTRPWRLPSDAINRRTGGTRGGQTPAGPTRHTARRPTLHRPGRSPSRRPRRRGPGMRVGSHRQDPGPPGRGGG